MPAEPLLTTNLETGPAGRDGPPLPTATVLTVPVGATGGRKRSGGVPV